MTMSLSAQAFQQAGPQRLTRPLHVALAQPGRDRFAGVAITVAAHVAVVAGLLFGIQVARPMLADKPIMVEMIQDQKHPDEKPVAAPRLAAPSLVTAPVPLFDIAPAPIAIAVAPPKAVTPLVAAAPAPVEKTTGEGRTSYLDRVLAQLNRFKQYPATARAAHIEGVAMVHFVMDRSGKVLSAEIAKSSGRPVLDREALALMDRASPLPAMPTDMKGDTLDAVVPISFSLH